MTNRDRAAQHLEDAGRRHFGRRDKTTLEHAGQRFRAAEEAVVRAGDVADRARDKVSVERAAVTLRATAEAAAADQRRTLVHDLAAVRDAVETTRPERVLAAAAGHPSAAAMRELLGDPPAPGPGRDTWCRIAEDFETALDHPDQTGDYLEHLARAALGGNRDAAHEIRAFVRGAVEARRPPTGRAQPKPGRGVRQLSPRGARHQPAPAGPGHRPRPLTPRWRQDRAATPSAGLPRISGRSARPDTDLSTARVPGHFRLVGTRVTLG